MVLTNTPDIVPRVEILPGISDHDAVYFEYKSKVTLNNNRRNPIPLYNKANWLKMKEDMKALKLVIEKMEQENESTENLWLKYKTVQEKTTKENIPHKIPGKSDSYPWITVEIKKLIRKRNRIYRKMIKQKTDTLKQQLKSVKKEIQHKLRRSHWDYINKLFVQREGEDLHQRTKRFWTYIKHQRASQRGIPPLKENGQLVTEAKKKASVLNKKFDQAFSEGKHYDKDQFKQKCTLDEKTYPLLPNINITTAGVKKLLQSLDPTKAAGPDGISPRILKELAEEIAPILCIIYRSSLRTGSVPEDWRTAHVSPIFKKGEHYDPGNYRPVSLTSVPCKVMEHIVVSAVMTHLEENNILNRQQHGFRKKRSCESQLLELSDQVTQNLEAGLETDIVILDFAKAFDKVNHSLLVHKLEHYGIGGLTNQWINSFLSDRKQAVVVEGCKSDFTAVKSGVPQGSVLGPCLFLVYINDLPTYVESNSRLFADDAAVDRAIISSKDPEILQNDLDSLTKWEDQWDAEFHTVKCQVLTVSRKRDKEKRTYKLHGHVLEQVEESKYLGLIHQQDGTWSRQIAETVKKANQTLGFLRRNLKIGSKRTKNLAYIALVRPLLEYAAPVWDPYQQREIEAIEKVQRRAARFVENRHRNTSSVGDMLANLQWPTLEERRKTTRVSLLKKILDEKVTIRCEYLKPARSRARRENVCHNQQLEEQFSRTDYRKMAFFPRTIRDWNRLSSKEIGTTTLDLLKQRI